ncbi:hypothetical protein GJA_169 [Janthinobacterium agaricidamnosum NBRC 102515 = DSM 9628]|uniref:Uncharacterized protein n=1 Tax=Janthinobacterium agaricidamnosum NBRC 102515 = DSM 9628 TaxID=1349767 RepID=W0V0L8_9BURK|nr:hypothetical protein GJA_169 [Janthinobacterium agaricidamnosum NBRC 102515 = DSM 9628]
MLNGSHMSVFQYVAVIGNWRPLPKARERIRTMGAAVLPATSPTVTFVCAMAIVSLGFMNGKKSIAHFLEWRRPIAAYFSAPAIHRRATLPVCRRRSSCGNVVCSAAIDRFPWRRFP